jgi:hypothetical protein
MPTPCSRSRRWILVRRRPAANQAAIWAWYGASRSGSAVGRPTGVPRSPRTNAASCSSVGGGAPRDRPTATVAATYLAMVFRSTPCLGRWRARRRRHCTGARLPAVRSHPAPDRPWTPPAREETRPGSGPGLGRGGKVLRSPWGKGLRIGPSAGGNLLGNHNQESADQTPKEGHAASSPRARSKGPGGRRPTVAHR